MIEREGESGGWLNEIGEEMSLFSSDSKGHPHPNSLRLKEKLALTDSFSVVSKSPTRPRNGLKSSLKSQRRGVQYKSEPVPRQPWFDRDVEKEDVKEGKQTKKLLRGKKNILFALDDEEVFQKVNASNSEAGDFKSAALECEWKFREAKNKMIRRLEEQEDCHKGLDPVFISICCQVLGDLAPLCGPIQNLLTDLKEEFKRYLFLDYAELLPGQQSLCSTPYFREVATLRAQLEEMTAQRQSLRLQLVEEVKKRRSLESSMQRMKVELNDTQRTLQEAKQNIASIAKVAEHARENYHRIRDDHAEMAKELQHVTKEKQDIVTATQHQVNIYQIRLTQLANELNKALQELTEKNKEINRLKLQR